MLLISKIRLYNIKNVEKKVVFLVQRIEKVYTFATF